MTRGGLLGVEALAQAIGHGGIPQIGGPLRRWVAIGG
jgi:hypothetical protein